MRQETQSPISKLPVELLWSIFLINTYPRYGDTYRAWTAPMVQQIQDRPLTIIHRSSHVCKKWRDIILGSPSLWGKVVDMTLLCTPVADDWMNEVIRRSGEQFLYITTDNSGLYRKIPTLVKLLDDHWERIRALNVTMKIASFDGNIISQVSQLLRRPTKSIQSFKLELKTLSPFAESPDFGAKPPLFADSAPSLTALHCANSFLNLDPPSPWLSQLQTLHIALENWEYTIPKILEALKEIPTLKTLTLSGRSFRSETPTLPKNSITLPSLKTIRLFIDYIMVVTTVLDTLIVPPGCTFIVITKYEGQLGEALDLSNSTQTFHRYAQNYFKAHRTTSLQLSITSDKFAFIDTCPLRGVSDFTLKVSSVIPFSGDQLSCMLGSLAGCNFKKVQYIDLVLPPSNITIRPDDRNLVRFLSGLSSLDMMELVEPTLEFFTSYRKDISPLIFPRLRTLISGGMPSQAMSSGPLLPFLKWRMDAGVAIKKLNLTELYFSTFPQDLDFLEEMTDLKVSWFAANERDLQSYREYLCGSGNPGMLRDIGYNNKV